MIDVIKVIGVGLVGVVLYNLLKTVKSELSVFVLIGCGVVIISMVLRALGGVFAEFQAIIDSTGLDNDLFSGVLKVVGVAYLTEYASSICKDSGADGLSSKILLAGKISIFALSLPLVKALVELLIGMVK